MKTKFEYYVFNLLRCHVLEMKISVQAQPKRQDKGSEPDPELELALELLRIDTAPEPELKTEPEAKSTAPSEPEQAVQDTTYKQMALQAAMAVGGEPKLIIMTYRSILSDQILTVLR